MLAMRTFGGELGLGCSIELNRAACGNSAACELAMENASPLDPCRVLVEIQPAACVVDESLDYSSSSSSDEEESPEARATARRSRREAAAAARPAGSSMPGWIGQLRQSSSGSSSQLWSPGRLCKVHASASQAAAATDWRQAVQAAAAELAAGVVAAELEAADVAACKVYCLASLLASQDGPTAAELREAVAAALPGVRPAVVPVTAVGSSAGADAAIQLEVLALRS